MRGARENALARAEAEAVARFDFGVLDAQRHVIDKLLCYLFPEGSVLLGDEQWLHLWGYMVTVAEEQLWLYDRWDSAPWLWERTPDGG